MMGGLCNRKKTVVHKKIKKICVDWKKSLVCVCTF